MRSILKRLLRAFCSTEAYAAMFKGGFVLLAAAAVSLTQVGPEIAKHESEYAKLRYEIEAKQGKKLESINCESLVEGRADCQFAKYLERTNERYHTSFNSWFEMLLAAGVSLTAAAAISFLLNAALYPPREDA